MKKDVVFTPKATKPTAPYSQAIKVGNVVYLSGVCGDDPQTNEIMGSGDIKIETKYAMENLRNTVEAAGGTIDDIVKVNVYINDINKMSDFNEIYVNYFTSELPARIAMQVAAFAGGANLEIDAVAIIS